MTRYFTSCDSIVTNRRRVEIQSTSEMSPYFTMTKCNKLITRNVLLSAQMGERASVVLICIITSRYNEVK